MGDSKRIIIIGGVAGGASAATRARRLSEKAEIILFERGDYVSFANCGLPYHIGGDIQNSKSLLVQTPESLFRRFRIDVRIKTEVIKIYPERKEILAKNHKTGKEYIERYDKIVLSPGALPSKPPIEGIDNNRVFTLRTINDMEGIKKVVDKMESGHAVVVGAGYIGLEITEALKKRNMKVTLVELASQVMITADPEMTALVKQQLTQQGIDLHLNTSVKSIKNGPDRLNVELSTGKTIESVLVILSIGVLPEVTLAKEAGIKLGETGGILVDEHMLTSNPDIYAVGDAVEIYDYVAGFKTLIPLAGPANRQGRIAADNIFGRNISYRNTQGTAICKIFDITFAMTGLNEKVLSGKNIPFEKIYIHQANHATYYPGSSTVCLKVLFDPSNGTLLGAQAVGLDGIDKRIDVLATAIRAKMTVCDLEHLELSYAPPYGSAKDPVNYAGFVASNVLRGDIAQCHYNDAVNPDNNQFLLDVRTVFEVKNSTIPGAYNIPLDEIRDRLGELPKDKELLVFCLTGIRSYIACRILSQHGFKTRNLSGGYKTYLMHTDIVGK